ncbi:SNO glutamine amidotransferase [Metschnikowia bicuspidata]|uniref:glutaminase n=1 Tax=Metschnikowia bicuspidata TaxID=27322 RepID=A0A4P9Z9C2_9ASCO|nr:SNO glutamine amidotransferase [Metschnikowia bicuspidata]
MTAQANYVIGVLALQGAFREHVDHLEQAVQKPDLLVHLFLFVEVRTPEQLDQCSALVIPGGESTSMSIIAERTRMLEPLLKFVREKPVWGTCAGLIMLAAEIQNARPLQKALGEMSISVARNAFGRQLELFEKPCDFSDFAPGLTSFRTIFIRAPVVSAILTADGRTLCTNTAPVKVLHALENGLVVAVRQGNKLGTSFHPELASDCSFHHWFVKEFVVGLDPRA